MCDSEHHPTEGAEFSLLTLNAPCWDYAMYFGNNQAREGEGFIPAIMDSGCSHNLIYYKDLPKGAKLKPLHNPVTYTTPGGSLVCNKTANFSTKVVKANGIASSVDLIANVSHEPCPTLLATSAMDKFVQNRDQAHAVVDGRKIPCHPMGKTGLWLLKLHH